MSGGWYEAYDYYEEELQVNAFKFFPLKVGLFDEDNLHVKNPTMQMLEARLILENGTSVHDQQLLLGRYAVLSSGFAEFKLAIRALSSEFTQSRFRIRVTGHGFSGVESQPVRSMPVRSRMVGWNVRGDLDDSVAEMDFDTAP